MLAFSGRCFLVNFKVAAAVIHSRSTTKPVVELVIGFLGDMFGQERILIWFGKFSDKLLTISWIKSQYASAGVAEMDGKVEEFSRV